LADRFDRAEAEAARQRVESGAASEADVRLAAQLKVDHPLQQL
jgi:hypothetical protein